MLAVPAVLGAVLPSPSDVDVSCPSLEPRRGSSTGSGLANGDFDEALAGNEGSASSSAGTASGANDDFEWACFKLFFVFSIGDCGLSPCSGVDVVVGNGENPAWLNGDTSFSLNTVCRCCSSFCNAPESSIGIQFGSVTSGALELSMYTERRPEPSSTGEAIAVIVVFVSRH